MKHKDLNRRQNYECSVLKGTAVLNTTVRQFFGDSSQPIKESLIKFDCECKSDCGVEQENSNGNFSYNWSICPANPDNKK